MQRTAITLALLSSWFAMPFANAQAPQFAHVIVIVQENRTPDNLFQGLCAPPYGSSSSCSPTPGPNQYDIQTKNWLDKTSSTGVTQPRPMSLEIPWNVNYSHMAFLAMCDFTPPPSPTCQMDGAADEGCFEGICPSRPEFRYVDYKSGVLKPYLELATQYGWANYMFQTNQGPSFPAHQFLFGGTSAPSAHDDHPLGIFAAELPDALPYGCTAPPGATVQLIKPPGVENPKDVVPPCFEHMTMGDFQQFSWKYYTPGASSGWIWTAPTAIQHICYPIKDGECHGTEFTNNVDANPSHVLTDIGNCQLRDVSWVIPTGPNSDHPIFNDEGGPSWVASIVDAIGNSTSCDGGNGYWKNTAIFITWDDWGGWYDHEPPTILAQPQGDYQYGFRVPLLVVSAYTPAGYIDNDRYDFGSILRFIEQNFGITEGALTFADARAHKDLTRFFKEASGPRTFRTIQSPLGPSFFINDKRPPTAPDDD